MRERWTRIPSSRIYFSSSYHLSGAERSPSVLGYANGHSESPCGRFLLPGASITQADFSFAFLLCLQSPAMYAPAAPLRLPELEVVVSEHANRFRHAFYRPGKTGR